MADNFKIEFNQRLEQKRNNITSLFFNLYGNHKNYQSFVNKLFLTIENAHNSRPILLLQRDSSKDINWFLSNKITGMSLYVDRFCGNLENLRNKINYFKNLGINLLHLMPLMDSPENESDGGYAVSDFRKVNEKFGNLKDLEELQKVMHQEGMYLMMDIVLNHTSHNHEWALQAKNGNTIYQDYYYCFDDRQIPIEFEKSLPEVFPESHPGNFTFIDEMKKWVMTVFHSYQWDLNFKNPQVFIEMLDTILYYGNLGIDILRIDAPAFIWKELGTTSQNLPQAHTLLRLIKQCVAVATPGMALLGEAIVAPKEIMKYFGEDEYLANECDFAYNATQMATLWDAIATSDTRVMIAAQQQVLKKPFGTSWINYTRCHDDIGLGYENEHIEYAGFNPYKHRKFIQEFYAGTHQFSFSSGALFSVNLKTNDARISGTLASLCGLEIGINKNDKALVNTAIKRIILLQSFSMFIGGIPMLFYGDEIGYTNDYSFLNDPTKSYDNRWMHRPIIDWENKNSKIFESHSIEHQIFHNSKKIIELRNNNIVFSDTKNLIWLRIHNVYLAGFIRFTNEETVYCFFNFSNSVCYLTWYAFKEYSKKFYTLYNLASHENHIIGPDDQYLVFQPYEYKILLAK